MVVAIRQLMLLILFLSILQPCLADKIIKNLTLADNGNLLVKHSHCGDRPWLIGSDCHCADSLNGIIYCDSSGDRRAENALQ